jgi:hypothetical protein
VETDTVKHVEAESRAEALARTEALMECEEELLVVAEMDKVVDALKTLALGVRDDDGQLDTRSVGD